MIYQLNVEKAIQAASMLIRKECRRTGRIRHLKLLYIASPGQSDIAFRLGQW